MAGDSRCGDRQPETALFPIEVDAFLKADYLSRSDIVLMVGTSLFSRAIRLATRSPFSHAALVFLIPDRETGFDRTFLIEAVPKGIAFRGLAEVVGADSRKNPRTAVAILRFERPWFDVDVQKLVRGRMLHFIRAGYDWLTIFSIAWSLATGIVWGQEKYIKNLQRSLTKHYQSKRLAPANFICSGLVQYGFLRTVFDLSQEGSSSIPHAAVAETIFDERLRKVEPGHILSGSPEALAELLATTPDEISRAPSLMWKYLILDGMVHAVTSRDLAIELLRKRSTR